MTGNYHDESIQDEGRNTLGIPTLQVLPTVPAIPIEEGGQQFGAKPSHGGLTQLSSVLNQRGKLAQLGIGRFRVEAGFLLDGGAEVEEEAIGAAPDRAGEAVVPGESGRGAGSGRCADSGGASTEGAAGRE